jgi:8-oxo-dGTP pyrophosphatase MutT (NUDIX family)
MAELCVLADGENCRIALNPWAQDYPGALRQDELEAFYASMGFRWRRDHVMVREPMAETMVHVAHDVPWQPTPNRCETILSDVRPPEDLTATSFAYPVVEDGRVLLSSSLKPNRDLEPAGGHIEPGEDQDAAVLREGVEEIGAVLTDLRPIGHQRLTSRAERPDPWRYPFPVSYQSFFAARIASLGERTTPEECGPPRKRRPRDITHPAHRLLAMRALQVA